MKESLLFAAILDIRNVLDVENKLWVLLNQTERDGIEVADLVPLFNLSLVPPKDIELQICKHEDHCVLDQSFLDDVRREDNRLY